MGGIGIYEANELEGDLRKREAKFRSWVLDNMDPELLGELCKANGTKLHWDDAAKGWIIRRESQLRESNDWLEEKQRKIMTLREFLERVLLELPVEYFEEGKRILGLVPGEGPERPFGADDAFRDSMSHAAAELEKSNFAKAEVYVGMMNAIARKQHAEAVDRATKHGAELMKMVDELKP